MRGWILDEGLIYCGGPHRGNWEHFDQQSYLPEVTRYVLLNPVRAGLVAHAREWPWSSYRPTVGDGNAPEWLAVAELLSEFSSNAATALNAFRQFVDAGVSAPAPWKELRQEIYLGDQSFIETVQARMLEARRTDREIRRPQRSATPSH